MRNMILGTDWWTDCDDAVAVRLVCRAVKEQKIRLLGVGINACMEYSVASLKGFLASVDAETGANCFVRGVNGNYKYVIKKFENAYYENAINSLL